MQRVIKFRAFDTESGKMIPFDFNNIYGYEGEICGVILPDKNTLLNNNSGYGAYNENPKDEYELKENKKHGINKALVIMQFTGLLDKNGKEIYEGDIVKLSGKKGGVAKFPYDGKKVARICPVFWSEFRASWSVQMTDLANNDLFQYCRNGETCEVIGNIHEHYYLLNGSFEILVL